MLDETHDQESLSWVVSANAPETDFPLQNLPFGVFRRTGEPGPGRIGVAIGDRVLDLAACQEAGLLDGDAADAGAACTQPTLNALMALGQPHWRTLRRRLSHLLRAGVEGEAGHRGRVEACLAPMSTVDMLLPAQIGDYTDFYASVHHATNVGRMMRPDQPLLPNYKWVPIGYHGRASSVVVSGTHVRRPAGQTRPDGADAPVVGPTRRLDYELEVGAFIGPGNPPGTTIPLEEAEDHVFGVCLVNDWSARDVQAWEYQPLGPFLAKNFATTVSPWVVTLDALAPFRVPPARRADGDPAPLPYLDSPGHRRSGGIDLVVEVALASAAMREQGMEPVRLSQSSFSDMFWTLAQLVTHHASNGCNLNPGDLVASGTVSGPEPSMRGCLLELTWRGSEPIDLPTGERRTFLEDGDEVVLSGYCDRGRRARRIGLSTCRGIVVPA
jgi:fumarylacetoacetase